MRYIKQTRYILMFMKWLGKIIKSDLILHDRYLREFFFLNDHILVLRIAT